MESFNINSIYHYTSCLWSLERLMFSTRSLSSHAVISIATQTVYVVAAQLRAQLSSPLLRTQCTSSPSTSSRNCAQLRTTQLTMCNPAHLRCAHCLRRRRLHHHTTVCNSAYTRHARSLCHCRLRHYATARNPAYHHCTCSLCHFRPLCHQMAYLFSTDLYSL